LSVLQRNLQNECNQKVYWIMDKDKDERSILDYVMTSQKMKDRIQKMHIDEEGLYVPTRHKAGIAVETDHKPIMVTINTDQPKEEECKVPKQQRRILVKEATFKKYRSGTDNSEALRKTWRNDNNIQQQYVKWESCMQNILDNTCITRTKKPLTS